MTDTSQTTVASAHNQDSPQEGKRVMFWGGEERVFENLDKFERISNPSAEDIDVAWEEVVDIAPSSDEGVATPNEAVWDDNLDWVELPLSESGFSPEDSSTEKDYVFEDLLGNISYEDAVKEDEEKVAEEEIILPELEKKEVFSPEEEVILPEPEINTEDEKEEEFVFPEVEDKEAEKEPLLPDLEIKAEEVEEEDEIILPELENQKEPEENDLDEDDDERDEEEVEDTAQVQEELAEATEEEQSLNKEKELSEEEQRYRELDIEKPLASFSKVGKLYQELVEKGKLVLALKNKLEKEVVASFEIIGNKNANNTTLYYVSYPQEEDQLLIKKTSVQHQEDQEEEHILSFANPSGTNLLIAIDDYPLYEEKKDLVEESKEVSVLDKLNKFIFLFEQEERKYQEKWEEKQEEQKKKKAFRNIFRNF